MGTNDSGLDYILEKDEQLLYYILESSTTRVRGKKTFVGVEAHRKIPIDILPCMLVGKLSKHTLLVVDSFQKMNGEDDEYLKGGVLNLYSRVEILQMEFGLSIEFLLSSSFMGTKKYDDVYKEITRRILGTRLEDGLRNSIPEGRGSDLSFSLHEVAVSAFMEEKFGMQVKVGQPREKLYDNTIGKVSGLGFSYLYPSIAFGTGAEVTPYNPRSGTKDGGIRVMLGDEVMSGLVSFALGPRKARRAFDRIYKAATLARQQDLYN